jgi:VWFA-related protein
MGMLSHRQGWSFAVLLSVFPCVFFAGSTSDPPLTTYHTGTSEVRVSFFATDENDRLVENLSRDDFAVVDSGMVIRDFRSLTRSNETPLDVVVLVDASESVAPRFQATLQDIRRLVSQRNAARGDEISVVAFAGLQPHLLCANDCRTSGAEQRLLAVKAGGATPLFDALIYTAGFLAKRHTEGVRQVVILFSDGGDTISRTSARDSLDAVTATGALVYSVNLDPSWDVSEGSLSLQRMAEATGGRSISLHKGVVDVLEAIMADLRASYVVTYQLPSHAAGFHSLRILPKHNLNLRFHCRRGYFYAASQ